MGLRQQFSTIVYSWDGKLSAEVFFLPGADMAVEASNAQSVLSELDVKFAAPVQFQDPVRGLAAFLASSDEHGPFSEERFWPSGLQDSREPNREYMDFAEELLRSRRVPFEESPLRGVSLEELISRASPTSLGALVGWIIAGNTPLLIFWIPTGIILVRSAVGIGRGLEEGLHMRIKRLFTPKGKKR